MLILTRNPGQAITFSNGVKITYLGKAGKQIRVGIDAPDDIKILRTELIERGENVLNQSEE